MNAAKRWPTLYIPHGGGPCFFMDPMPGLPPTLWDGMEAYLSAIAEDVGSGSPGSESPKSKSIVQKPKAILVISAHWETARPTVHGAAKYHLLYDYYGFPEETYQLTYPVPGSPELAARVRGVLQQANIATDIEYERGLDHGVFIPFKLIYPDADVPIVQLSLQQNLDAAQHLAIGRALAPLRDEGVLIVGSGMSYHNLAKFFSSNAASDDASAHFDTWLADAISAKPAQRDALLADWTEAHGALQSHPRSEHLLPLMVVAGAAADDIGKVVYREKLLGKTISAFQFGG